MMQMDHCESPKILRGRRFEQQALDRLVADTRTGMGGALVLRGEGGIGKTSLLDYLETCGTGCQILRVAGVESETELDFAVLHRLCGTVLDLSEQLPALQRDALSNAFGFQAQEGPDRFLVGAALHAILRAVSDAQPLLCIVDEVDAVDRASIATLAFVARRLSADPIAIVFAGRAAKSSELAGLPVLEIQGVRADDARALVESTVVGPLDPAVRDRILAEARGNPDALLEQLRGTPDKLAGGFGMADAAELPASTMEDCRRRLAQLSAETRHLLLIGAADPTGDPVLFWRAAAQLDLGTDAAAAAASAGMLTVGQRVLFRRPLDRTAIYRSATLEDRRAVHAALACAATEETDAVWRAWHRANATVGLDEGVAADLEQSAERARSRGGLAAAATFFERAAALSPDAISRVRRTLAAAQAKHLAGAPGEAIGLLAITGAGALDGFDRAHASLIGARIKSLSDERDERAQPLLEAASTLTELDVMLAGSAYQDALFAALSRPGGEPRCVAEAILAASDLPSDLLTEGLAHFILGDYDAAAPALQQAIDALRVESSDSENALVRVWLAGYAACALGDVDSWDDLTRRHLELARTTGALAMLPAALNERVKVELAFGNVGAATELVAEADSTLAATGSNHGAKAPALVAAWQGDEAQWTAAAQASGPVPSPWVSLDLIEAAVRAGESERAAEPLLRLSRLARASGHDWAVGADSAARALLSRSDAAQQLYRVAIERAESAGVPFFLARTYLLFGEWLRRSNRRLDARQQLRVAQEMFEELGAAGFAERARRELLATGATARKRIDCTRDDLTAQEAQIAHLAASGHTNPEIGARLFLSPRTVEWHLRKVYPKLGVRGRRELRQALPQAS
jgi:DNA-binding CsgD family transcriptional regulator